MAADTASLQDGAIRDLRRPILWLCAVQDSPHACPSLDFQVSVRRTPHPKFRVVMGAVGIKANLPVGDKMSNRALGQKT